jgi:uncharacterized protein DUF2380
MDRRLGLGAIVVACWWVCLTPAPGRAESAAPSIAVTELGYIDSSGELRDQHSDHARRLKSFVESLQDNLQSSGKFRVVSLDCPADGCAASTTDPAELIAKAEKAGANYVLVGGVHKMSTLVQWAKVEILNVGTRSVVFDRLLTFRGDDDAAWVHAETFLAREILDQNGLK